MPQQRQPPQATPPKQPHPAEAIPQGSPGTGEALCPTCGGKGTIAGRKCEECDGSGIIIQGIGGA